MTRLLVLLAVASAALVLAPSASAAVTRADGAAGGVECAGPCPSLLVFKGTGSGQVTSEPNHVNCSSPTVCAFSPDNLVLGPSLDLKAHPGANSYLRKWECTGGTVNAENECVLNLEAPGAQYTICVVFETYGRAPTPDTPCPPPAQPPPPPPPSGPPPLGSR